MREKPAKALFFICAAFSIFAVFAIVFYIFYASVPAISQIGFFKFVFGGRWAPNSDVPEKGLYGILPMIAGSIAVTAGALLVGGGIGVFTAVFLYKFCPKRLKGPFYHIINFLAGIPSVVYGAFGLVVLVPFLNRISPTGSGKGLLASVLILSIMILPTVAGISKDALEAVPKAYGDGALAIGAAKEQALFRVEIGAAKSGIMTGLVLGAGRAVGETMAVIMVAGNLPNFPKGLFGSIETLTINMVLEMGYAAGLHKDALVATGSVLLTFILLLNIALGLLKRNKNGIEKKIKDRKGPVSALKDALIKSKIYKAAVSALNKLKRCVKRAFRAASIFLLKVSERIFGKRKNRAAEFKRRGYFEAALKYFSVFVAAAVLAALFSIVWFILINGVPHLSLDFLFGESGNAKATLAPAFVSTGMLILLSLGISLPIGIGAAVYLAEYSNKNGKLVKIIRLFTETLAGIPSIVFGFFGMIFFCGVLGFGYSLWAGGLTLSLIILPTIIRSTEEAMIAVHDSLREGSYALGAGKVKTIFKIVIPSALSGIATAVILGVGRVVGESAALVYTSRAVAYMPSSYSDTGSSFSVMMWMFWNKGYPADYLYATAAVLLIIVAALNGLIIFANKKLKRGDKGKITENRRKI